VPQVHKTALAIYTVNEKPGLDAGRKNAYTKSMSFSYINNFILRLKVLNELVSEFHAKLRMVSRVIYVVLDRMKNSETIQD